MERKILYIAALFPFAACFLLSGHAQLNAIVYTILIALVSSVMVSVRDGLKEQDESKIGILTWPAILLFLAYAVDAAINKYNNLDSSTTAYAFILLFIDYITLYGRYKNLKNKDKK